MYLRHSSMEVHVHDVAPLSVGVSVFLLKRSVLAAATVIVIVVVVVAMVIMMRQRMLLMVLKVVWQVIIRSGHLVLCVKIHSRTRSARPHRFAPLS